MDFDDGSVGSDGSDGNVGYIGVFRSIMRIFSPVEAVRHGDNAFIGKLNKIGTDDIVSLDREMPVNNGLDYSNVRNEAKTAPDECSEAAVSTFLFSCSQVEAA